MDTKKHDPQAVYKAHISFGEAHPNWMQQAVEVTNVWGRGERVLQHAIAEALMAAYELGKAGEPPPEYRWPDTNTAPARVIRRRS